jgi:hypothetical protein
MLDNLLPDEEALLLESKRCTGCGHLDILHDRERQTCEVGECPCEGGMMPDERKRLRAEEAARRVAEKIDWRRGIFEPPTYTTSACAPALVRML